MHLPSDSDTDFDFVPAGGRVGPGEYSCTGCGYTHRVTSSQQTLPPCPACGAAGEWEIVAIEHRHD